jgi:hypothetical protein
VLGIEAGKLQEAEFVAELEDNGTKLRSAHKIERQTKEN